MPQLLGGYEFIWPYYLGGFLAYLLGSIPFGLVLTRFSGAGDIRKIGSGNIGATNVLRTGRRGLALATLVLDGGKGAVAVGIADRFGPDMAVIAAAFAVIGHLFPVWLKFRGGKGVATTLGVLLAISFKIGLFACATWLMVAWISGYSSLAALVALGLAPLVSWPLIDRQRTELTLFMAILVFFRHRENILRLIRGQEGKINLGRR